MKKNHIKIIRKENNFLNMNYPKRILIQKEATFYSGKILETDFCKVT